MIGPLIAAAAEEWIGTPFHWQASCKGAGADCKGLIAGVARELGREEADSVEALCGDYGAIVPAAKLKAGLARLFDKVASPQAGDILLIRMGGAAQHLAIYAPRLNQPTRTIEALCEGPKKVRPFRRSPGEVDSIWRWRD